MIEKLKIVRKINSLNTDSIGITLGKDVQELLGLTKDDQVQLTVRKLIKGEPNGD